MQMHLRIMEVIPRSILVERDALMEILEKVDAAHVAEDWRGALKWEGRIDDIWRMAPDMGRRGILVYFLAAHRMGLASTGNTRHALSVVRLLERRVELLGKMERFRDQGVAVCDAADQLVLLEGRQQDGKSFFQRARDLGKP